MDLIKFPRANALALFNAYKGEADKTFGNTYVERIYEIVLLPFNYYYEALDRYKADLKAGETFDNIKWFNHYADTEYFVLMGRTSPKIEENIILKDIVGMLQKRGIDLSTYNIVAA